MTVHARPGLATHVLCMFVFGGRSRKDSRALTPCTYACIAGARFLPTRYCLQALRPHPKQGCAQKKHLSGSQRELPRKMLRFGFLDIILGFALPQQFCQGLRRAFGVVFASELLSCTLNARRCAGACAAAHLKQYLGSLRLAQHIVDRVRPAAGFCLG